MANLMDNTPFVNAGSAQTNNLGQIVQLARQNPSAFEEYVRRTNPQAYQRALQLRNTANPQALVTEMARAQGMAPNVLRLFGL